MRRKFRYVFTGFLLISVLYVVYQMIMLLELNDEHKKPVHHERKTSIRGIHWRQEEFYRPDSKNRFACIHTATKIPFSKVNDDYCDCEDGSDEPGTNACEEGRFFCATQGSTKRKIHPNSIESAKVNDGICDCCDGSDEWKNVQLIKNIGPIHPPCPIIC